MGVVSFGHAAGPVGPRAGRGGGAARRPPPTSRAPRPRPSRAPFPPPSRAPFPPPPSDRRAPPSRAPLPPPPRPRSDARAEKSEHGQEERGRGADARAKTNENGEEEGRGCPSRRTPVSSPGAVPPAAREGRVDGRPACDCALTHSSPPSPLLFPGPKALS